MAFQESPDFVRWFLGKTKFNDLGAAYFWSRSNHPYGGAEVPVPDAGNGTPGTVIREGETDVLVVFDTPASGRVALHIENKRLGGHFTDLQPQMYRARAAKWSGDPKYGSYGAWEIVLVAPRQFCERNAVEAAKFDRLVTHEQIAAHVPLFGINDRQG